MYIRNFINLNHSIELIIADENLDWDIFFFCSCSDFYPCSTHYKQMALVFYITRMSTVYLPIYLKSMTDSSTMGQIDFMMQYIDFSPPLTRRLFVLTFHTHIDCRTMIDTLIFFIL